MIAGDADCPCYVVSDLRWMEGGGGRAPPRGGIGAIADPFQTEIISILPLPRLPLKRIFDPTSS